MLVDAIAARAYDSIATTILTVIQAHPAAVEGLVDLVITSAAVTEDPEVTVELLRAVFDTDATVQIPRQAGLWMIAANNMAGLVFLRSCGYRSSPQDLAYAQVSGLRMP